MRIIPIFWTEGFRKDFYEKWKFCIMMHEERYESLVHVIDDTFGMMVMLNEDIQDWLDANHIEYQWRSESGFQVMEIYFQNENDAIAFKLGWS